MKKKKTDTKRIPFKGVKVKWVRRVQMWCKTWFESNGTQKQDWSREHPVVCQGDEVDLMRAMSSEGGKESAQ